MLFYLLYIVLYEQLNNPTPSFRGALFGTYYLKHFLCRTRLQSNLPFTAKRDYSRNLKAQLIAVFFNRYNGCKSFFFISKCSGNILISYMEADAIFCTRMDLTKMFVISLDFTEIKNIKNMSMGMTYRTHKALQLLYFDLFLMKQYIRINPDI